LFQSLRFEWRRGAEPIINDIRYDEVPENRQKRGYNSGLGSLQKDRYKPFWVYRLFRYKDHNKEFVIAATNFEIVIS
jgi:hypothetical protein